MFPNASHGFTLIELLAVIAVIAVLAAIIYPVVGSVRKSAASANDVTNLRQIGVAHSVYMMANGGEIATGQIPSTGQLWFYDMLRPYLDIPLGVDVVGEVFISPLDPEEGGINNASFKPVHRRSYAVNRNTLISPSQGSYVALNINRVEKPADALYAVNYEVSKRHTNWVELNTSSLQYVPSDWRDDGEVSALFLDGHVDLVKREDLMPGGDKSHYFQLQ